MKKVTPSYAKSPDFVDYNNRTNLFKLLKTIKVAIKNYLYPLICCKDVLIPLIKDELNPCISISFKPAMVQP